MIWLKTYFSQETVLTDTNGHIIIITSTYIFYIFPPLPIINNEDESNARISAICVVVICSSDHESL